jgi:deoxycytidylate deaminase
MKSLNYDEIKRYLEEAARLAKESTCKRDKCGSVIVKDGEIIGGGFNSPPGNLESQRRCDNNKKEYHKKVTDKTCCIHAEQRAILNALSKNPEKLIGSILYFVRLDSEDKISFAGKPYCTICSKLSLDVGIKEFVLLHEEGSVSYPTEEYNSLSFNYKN